MVGLLCLPHPNVKGLNPRGEPTTSLIDPPRKKSGAAQERHGSVSSVSTDADDCVCPGRHGPQLLHRLAQVARARRSEGMSDCDGAAVGIDPIPWKCAELEVHP